MTIREQLEKLGYRAAREVQQIAVCTFYRCKQAAIKCHRVKKREEQLSTTLGLLLDDALSHGLSKGATGTLLRGRLVKTVSDHERRPTKLKQGETYEQNRNSKVRL